MYIYIYISLPKYTHLSTFSRRTYIIAANYQIYLLLNQGYTLPGPSAAPLSSSRRALWLTMASHQCMALPLWGREGCRQNRFLLKEKTHQQWCSMCCRGEGESSYEAPRWRPSLFYLGSLHCRPLVLGGCSSSFPTFVTSNFNTETCSLNNKLALCILKNLSFPSPCGRRDAAIFHPYVASREERGGSRERRALVLHINSQDYCRRILAPGPLLIC